MAVYVTFQNPLTKKIKSIKAGFSWTCFFFWSFFGLPLFLRGLIFHGLFAIGFYCWYMYAIFGNHEDTSTTVVAIIAACILPFVYGFTANKLQAKRLLSNGWIFAAPNSPEAAMATAIWGLGQSLPNNQNETKIITNEATYRDSLAAVEKLAELRKSGAISEEEFATQKSRFM